MPGFVDRRRFLAGTAAAAASLALSRISACAETSTARIRKAVKYHMVQEPLPPLGKLRLLKELGYEGVEVRKTEKVEREQLRDASEASGIPIHGVLNSSDPDLRGAIDLAKFYGSSSVLVVAGRVNERMPYDRNYAETQQWIREAAPYAEDQGIRLLIENVWNNFLLSPLEMARYIDEIDSPVVGVYFDVGNVVRYGWPDQWIRILGKRIVKLDIKEYSRAKQLNEGLRKGFEVEIGEGDCDWPAVRQALMEIGYTQGWATAEVPGGDRQRLAAIKERMDRVLAF